VNDEYQHIINSAIIILASGNSSRLGHPKQLLKYKNQTLLRHAANTALATGMRPVLVVLGADRETFKDELSGTEVNIVVNNEWNEGMASSIRSGIKELQDNFPSVDGAIIMVCDQPFVHKDLLIQLLETQKKSGKPVVAAYYEGVKGTPVLFHHRWFPELMALTGDKGARKILEKNPLLIETIPFPEGKLDIDTESDYKELEKW